MWNGEDAFGFDYKLGNLTTPDYYYTCEELYPAKREIK